MPLKILYLGSFSASFCTEVHLSASLSELGHEVIEIDERQATLERLRNVILDCDLLLYTRTIGLWQGGSRPLLDFIRGCGIPTVSVHLDLYSGLKRGERLSEDPFWQTRYVFSADGGSEEFFARHGINHFWLRPGVYGAECYLAKPSPELATDVLFVGSGGPRSGYHQEWTYRDELIDFLRQTYGSRFSKHGGPPMGPVGTAHVRGHKLNTSYASAKVVVGDTLCLGPGDSRTPRFSHSRYTSDRLYETVGRGGFLIYPRIDGVADDELIGGEHCAWYTYGDFVQLKGLIDYYLDHNEERERIRRAGLLRVRDRCTYVHRMREMLRVIADSEPRLAELILDSEP